MSSDIIKQMAARILSTIKNQYPNYYNDNSRKEYLVRIILSKIDSFSKQINPQTAQPIVNQIINDIIKENHPEKNQRVSFPQKPRENIQPSMSSLSRTQFERNNINQGRPTAIPQRPQTSTRQQIDNSFVPVSRNFEEFNNDYNIGVPVRLDNDDIPVENRYEKLLQDRQHQNIQRNRPPTPDFSLDGSGKKKREQPQQTQHTQQYQQVQQSRQQSKPPVKNNNFTHNPQTEFGIIGLNELPQNNTGFSSFDVIDDGFSNIDVMNTGINPIDIKYDESVSVDARLRQLQNDRNYTDNIVSQELPKKNNEQYRETFNNLPAPINTNIRETRETTNDLYNIVNTQINREPEQIKQNNIQQSNNQIKQNNIPQQQPIKQENDKLQLLLNQNKLYQEEINKLKNIIDKPNNENIEHIKDKLNELEEYKSINIKLQDRIVELQKQIQTNNDSKVQQLQKVKEETTNEIEKLKKIQEDIVIKNSENKNLETHIKKIIKNNISFLENSEEIIYINNHQYNFNYTLKNITSIEIKELELPFNKYNITLNNNKLHIKFYDNISKKEDNDSDTANAIDSDIENLIDSEIDDNELTLTIIMGNYTIENLISLLNKQLNKYDINVSMSKTTHFISFKSKNKFDLLFEDNTILPNLGFNLSNQTKYINSNKYSGTKAYDFRIDKIMNIYTNISSKPIMQYKTNSNEIQSKKIPFNPIISELNSLEFKFIDSKTKEFIFDPENGLEFNIQVIIRYINSNQNIINNELNETNDISSDDVFAIAKLSIRN